MAYAPHYLLSFGGRLTTDGTHNEQWNCNIRAVGHIQGQYLGNGNWSNTDFVAEDPEALLAIIYPKLQTWMTTNVGSVGASLVGLMTSAYLDYLKLNKIGANGKYSDAGVTHQHVYGPNVHGAAGATLPWDLTPALSWTTDLSRGPGAHGRVYPPAMFTVTGAGDPTITAVQLPNLVTLAKNLLAACSTNIDGSTVGAPNLLPVVASAKTAKNYMISGVRVGNISDVQRRRKNGFREAYTSSVWP